MVKTFRELWLDEERHSTSFETHKYPGDLDVEKAGSLLFLPPVCRTWKGWGCPVAGVLGRTGSRTQSRLQPNCTIPQHSPFPACTQLC